jgi:hypothetical protein
VNGTIGVGDLSLSDLLARLKAFKLPWSDSVLTQGVYRRHFNIHRNGCPWSQNFFLRGYLKSNVYEKKPGTTVDFKQNIREEVAAISPNMLQ